VPSSFDLELGFQSFHFPSALGGSAAGLLCASATLVSSATFALVSKALTAGLDVEGPPGWQSALEVAVRWWALRASEHLYPEVRSNQGTSTESFFPDHQLLPGVGPLSDLPRARFYLGFCKLGLAPPGLEPFARQGSQGATV